MINLLFRMSLLIFLMTDKLPHEQNNVLFEYGCAIGNMEICKVQYEHCTNVFTGFSVAAINNHLHICEWIYEQNPTFYMDEDIDSLHTSICNSNNLDMLKFLHKICSTIDIDEGFSHSCSKGYKDIYEYLYELDKDIINRVNIHEICQLAQILKHDETYKWICEITFSALNIDFLKTEYNMAFDKNDLSMCKWFYERIGKFDDIKEKFCHACIRGHVNMAQWLCSIEPDVDELISYNLLWNVYYKDNINFFKWLLNMAPTIDICDDHDLITIACINNNVNIAQFIYARYLIKNDEWKNLSFYRRMMTTNIYTSLYDRIDEIFSETCYRKQYKACRWLIELKPELSLNIQWENLLLNEKID